jgi:Ca-activated chloride channel family protein
MEGSAQSTTLEGGTQSTTLQGGTQSTTLQGGTQSTTLQGGTQSTTLQGGTQSTMLQGGTGATMLQGGTGSTMIQAQVKKDAGPLNVLILLDASQTMGQGMDNVLPSKQEQKMAVAKRVLKTTLQAIPVDVNVGLRVFGQSFNNAGSDCRQTALLVPIGKNNHQAIIDEIEPLTPKGMTPLAYTLMQAQRDFAGLPGERHIVLISDGFETCGGDPCSYIKRLSAMGYAMKVDIIGMGLKHDKIARDHLNCITQASGGHYYDADTAGELADHLKQSMLDAAGQGEVSGVVISKTHR